MVSPAFENRFLKVCPGEPAEGNGAAKRGQRTNPIGWEKMAEAKIYKPMQQVEHVADFSEKT